MRGVNGVGGQRHLFSTVVLRASVLSSNSKGETIAREMLNLVVDPLTLSCYLLSNAVPQAKLLSSSPQAKAVVAEMVHPDSLLRPSAVVSSGERFCEPM